MRLFLLTCLTMAAFAGNSLLNRFALGGAADPMSFALIRVASGAAMLWILVVLRAEARPSWHRKRLGGGLALACYMAGFSAAYVTLDAGIGALILFGMVQITMFGAALAARNRVPPQRWAGAAIAFAGLAYLMWPAGAAVSPMGAGFMLIAGLGWGAYSLMGAGARDALGDTAANFAVCLPLILLALVAVQLSGAPLSLDHTALALGVLSGVVTSGLGYALWYKILPLLDKTTAAVAQLTVPIIAAMGGALLLSEPISARLIIAGALVLGGVALSLIPQRTAPKR